MRRRRGAAWGAALACCVALTVAASAPAKAAPAPLPAQLDYVALGDSYTAGPLIPVLTGTPAGCLRSTQNYPHLVAKELRTATFRDVSCSGAATPDLSRPQKVTLGRNPAQLDALSGGTDLVTLGIGGNDIGFAGIVTTCARLSPTKPTGAACRAHYTAGGTDQLAARVAATAPKVAAALRAIKQRSADARVLLVGYPVLAPDAGPGCFPVVPFTAGDVAYLRGIEKKLNAMLAGEAKAAGVTYVDTYTPSIGHDWCKLPGTKWVEGLIPTAPAYPAHPNALGMQASARAVLAALR